MNEKGVKVNTICEKASIKAGGRSQKSTAVIVLKHIIYILSLCHI